MRATFLLLLTVITLDSFSQQPWELGAEYIRSMGKGYAASKVAGRAESFDDKNSFSAGITYQLASSKSYSVSRGFGVYAGYRRSFGNNLKGNNPFAGARVLFSFENFEGQTRRNSLLITPMAEAGYHLVVKRRYFAAPAIGFGYTMQITKDYHSLDEDNGKRIMPSLSAGYRFRIN